MTLDFISFRAELEYEKHLHFMTCFDNKVVREPMTLIAVKHGRGRFGIFVYPSVN